jgi:hypothetical protein
LILVDTKYEFGLTKDGQVMLIDEVHTPDSSRFWKADNYQKLFDEGKEQENFDKEFIRLAYAEKGYRGDGEIPSMPDDLWTSASRRYIAIYEILTGKTFKHGEYPIEPRLRNSLRRLKIRTDKVFSNIEQISQEARNLWDRNDILLAGKLIDTHIPKDNRAKWMAGILDIVTPMFEKKQSIDDVIDFAKNPNKFGEGLNGNAKSAHQVVDNANNVPYLPEQFPLTIFILVAHAGKVIYNAQNFVIPFDNDSAITVFEMAKIMSQKFLNEEFERNLWAALCPINFLVTEKQPIYPEDWIENIEAVRNKK